MALVDPDEWSEYVAARAEAMREPPARSPSLWGWIILALLTGLAADLLAVLQPMKTPAVAPTWASLARANDLPSPDKAGPTAAPMTSPGASPPRRDALGPLERDQFSPRFAHRSAN